MTVDEITPSITTAAHGETIATNTNGKAEQNGKVQQNGTKPEDFSYPPYIPVGTEYTTLKQYHSKPTKLRVACVGAGASGLCLAYKMERQMVPGSWELTLFEKNPQFGGTWYENTYPGVACDVSGSQEAWYQLTRIDPKSSVHVLLGPETRLVALLCLRPRNSSILRGLRGEARIEAVHETQHQGD